MMKHEILYKPSYAVLKLEIEPGQAVMAEAGSMVSMSPDMQVKTRLNTSYDPRAGGFSRLLSLLLGIFVALMRKILGGESFFLNRYTSEGGSGELLLAPMVCGDVVHRRLEGEKVFVQAGSYLASTPEIRMKLKFTGIRGLFSGESLFLLECEGRGDLWLNAYGGIELIEVTESCVVDTGHLVAFESSLNWSVRTVGGLKSTVLSGEGLVIEFRGSGRLWIQSRNLKGFAGWITPLLPQ